MAEYYVATTGNDSGTGAIGDPWKTLTFAANQLTAGDTLYIRGGTHQDGVDVTFAANGTAANRITISGYPGETAIIDGNDTYPANSVYEWLVDVTGDYVTIRDVAIKNSKGSGLSLSGDYCYGFNIAGENTREAGMILTGTGDVFDGCTMTNSGFGYDGNNQTTWGSGIGTIGTDCVIRRCTSHTNIGEGINPGGAAANCVVEDCVVYNNDSYNLYIDSSTGTIVRRNLVYDTTETPSSGIAIGAEVKQPSDLTIENNIVMGCFVNLNVDSNVTQLVNVKIAHNTLVNAKGNAEGYNMGVYIRNITTYLNSSFKDNIVIEDSESRKPITLLDADHAGLVFDYNCYNKAVDAEETGAHDVVGDPKLAKVGATTAGNLSPNYFALLADSPCKDAGVNVGTNEDYFKSPRPEGAGFDIGAIELDQHTTTQFRRVEIK